jgi:lipopolysaccharide transport system permease protein
MLSLAISLFLAALNVKFRDVKYAVPFAIQIWMYTSPVIYPSGILPHSLERWMAINPAAGLIDAFRHCMIPQSPAHWGEVGISAGMTVVMFVGSLVYFHRSERAFADII